MTVEKERGGYSLKEGERVIILEIEDTNIKPIPVGTGGGKPQPEMDALPSIVKDFNDTYGNIEWKNRVEVQLQIEEPWRKRQSSCKRTSPILTSRIL